LCSLISTYLKGSYSWQHVLTKDKYNEIATSITTTIKGRLESELKLIRSATGEEITYTATALLITDSAVVVGDKIDGRTVLSSSIMQGLDGSTKFYEVYLI